MTCYRRIVCAIDLSEPSRRAMAEAARIAGVGRASLTLLHVAGAVRAAAPFAPPPAAATSGAGVDALEAWRAEAERSAGSAVSTVELDGPVAATVASYARDMGADLVVVGSHGRTGPRRLVLGSVAEEVARIAPCPVLIVPSV